MTNTTKGRSLELFFIDGNPEGMLTAEVFNWTGHVLMTPRTRISEALGRKEAGYTGVYLLFGENEEGPLAYIGETEDIGKRLRKHVAEKDWWTSAVLITTTANNLNKAHVKYLEARLVEEARAIGKIPLDNDNSPTRPGLTEASESNMEAFLEQLLMVLPALRIDLFLRKTRPQTQARVDSESNSVSPEFELITPKHGIHARAIVQDGEFIVQTGSKARKEWMGAPHGYSFLYEELVSSGVMIEAGEHREFTENYAFNSASAAATVLNGRSTNGQTKWKLKGTNKTYKEWEAETLTAQQGEADQ